MTYELVKQNFKRGLYSVMQVKVAVKAGVITPEQFEEITGEKYEA